MILRTSYVYPAPTLDALDLPSPGWTWSSRTVEEWGTFRIEAGATWGFDIDSHIVKLVDGTDVTTVNDVATLINELNYAEPYGETTGMLTFPGLTIYSYAPWMEFGTNIDIYRVLPPALARAQGRAEVPYWHGFVASTQIADGDGVKDAVSVHLFGALFGEASLRAHQPLMLDSELNIGSAINQHLNPASYGRPLPLYRFEFIAAKMYDGGGNEITTRRRGSRGTRVIDHCDELLGIAQQDNIQYTISRAYDTQNTPQARLYYIRRKSESVSSAIEVSTIMAGGHGVKLDFSIDGTESANAVYGEGLAPNGSRWRNIKYPMLVNEAPAYPGPMKYGDTDAMFAYDAVTALQYQLRAGGWPNVQINGIFDADTVTALSALQRDLGRRVDGDIDSEAEWLRVWSHTTGFTDLSSAYALPIAVVNAAEPYTYSADGSVVGANDSYDGRIRVERTISYGEGVTKDRAMKHARRIVNQSANDKIIGTITLTSDPVERSRYSLREGSFIRVQGMFGNAGRDFYIAGISHKIDDGESEDATILTVSEYPFDLLDLSTRIARDREANTDPAKAFFALRARPQRPFRDVLGWDEESGAGAISPRTVTAGWNIIRFVGAQRGTVAAIKANCSTSRFALALFGTSVTKSQVAAVVPDPLAEDTTLYGWWSRPAVQDDLTDLGFIEAWGEFGEAAGYWPGRESADHAVTGKMRDELSWNFVSAEPPFLWLAVYIPSGSATFSATMRVVIEE